MSKESEYIALKILQSIDPAFIGFEKSEAPDFISPAKNAGLEVTGTQLEDVEMRTSFFVKKLKGNRKEDIPQKQLEVFQDERFGMFASCDSKSRYIDVGRVSDCKAEYSQVFAAIENKYGKNYTGFDHLYLYAFARHLFIDHFDVVQLCKVVDQCEKQYNTRFEKIYIDFYCKILQYSPQDKTHQIIEYEE